MSQSDFQHATHVQTEEGRIEKIASKWGIDAEGRLAKPSEGGFGCITESGREISMWKAWKYYARREGDRAVEVRLGHIWILEGLMGRWLIVHPVLPNLAWSGRDWVDHDQGIPTGSVQICNFDTWEKAEDYAKEVFGARQNHPDPGL